MEQTKSFLLWPPREEGKYPEEVTFKKPIATASVFCGRVDKRFDYLAGDRKLARHACESLYSQVECAGSRDSRTLFQVAAAVTRWAGKNSPSSDFSIFLDNK